MNYHRYQLEAQADKRRALFARVREMVDSYFTFDKLNNNPKYKKSFLYKDMRQNPKEYANIIGNKLAIPPGYLSELFDDYKSSLGPNGSLNIFGNGAFKERYSTVEKINKNLKKMHK
jgi:hypothetical protein